MCKINTKGQNKFNEFVCCFVAGVYARACVCGGGGGVVRACVRACVCACARAHT